MITEDYVSFEAAKLLKEKGFDENCTHYINQEDKIVQPFIYGCQFKNSDDGDENMYCCPTVQMAMKWMRSKNIFIDIFHYNSGMAPFVWHVFAYNINKPQSAKTYEDAANDAIMFVLENWNDVNDVLKDYYKYDEILPKI